MSYTLNNNETNKLIHTAKAIYIYKWFNKNAEHPGGPFKMNILYLELQ